MDSLWSLLNLEAAGWRDILDVSLVALLLYGVFFLIRRTRGAHVAVGVLLFIVMWRFALWMELQTLGTILEMAVTALPFVIVLLFQGAIRRALMALARNPLFRFFGGSEDQTVIEALSLVALSLSTQRLGAIIVIERELGLRTYIDSGIPVDARVSYELLLSLFHPRSPLHDGAVILSQDRIAAASCLLPLTSKPQLSVKFGSRHRAAIGLSEETDALVIVISEERGVISLVRDGEIRALEAKELRDALLREMAHQSQPTRRPAMARA